MAGYSGYLALGIKRFHFGSQAPVRLPFILGTSSFSPDDSYVVAQGDYEVVVPVALSIVSADQEDPPLEMLACGYMIEIGAGSSGDG